MAKLTLTDVTSGYASTTAVNANNDLIEAALENTLSRDGATPNNMNANFDMNGFNILNQGNPITVSGFVWEGQWLTSTLYTVGDVIQNSGTAYICIVEHTSGVFATDLAALKWELVVEANMPTQTGNNAKFLQTDGVTATWQVPDSVEVSFTQVGIGAVTTTVQNKLCESISVKDFGAIGDGVADDSAAFQSAINAAAGRPIKIPEGNYTLLTSLTYNTTGLGHVDGLKLIGVGKRKVTLNNNTGGVLITITAGTSSADFQYNGELSGFTIKNPLGTGTKGVLIDSSFQSRIDIKVMDHLSHGIHLYSTVGDATDCCQVDMRGCETSTNGGDGIRIEGDSGAIQSEVWADGGRHIGNTGLAINMISAIGCTARKNIIAYNLGGGIAVTRTLGGNYSKLCVIEDNEFDSNAGTQVLFDFAVGCKESKNYYVVNLASPVVTKLVNITANAINITSEQALPRIAPTYTGVTAFTIASGAIGISIINAEWSSWESTGNTKYSDAGTRTIILESNETLRGVAFPSTAVASTNPNCLDDYEEGVWTPIDISGAGLSFSGVSGYYTKIGRLVTISGQWTLPSTANGSNMVIGGLPFTIGQNSAGALLQNSAISGDTYLLPSGTTSIFIYGASFTRRTNANYSTVAVYFSGSYIV